MASILSFFMYCPFTDSSGTRGNGQASLDVLSVGKDFDYMTAVVNNFNQTSPELTWRVIRSGCISVCGITESYSGLCWGSSAYGQTGTQNNTVPAISVPSFVANPWTGQVPRTESEAAGVWASLVPGMFSTCGITTNGTAFCWGENARGSLGIGNVSDPTVLPKPVYGGHTWSSISTTVFPSITEVDVNSLTSPFCGVTTAGELYCWGDDGKYSNGTGGPEAAPVLIPNNGSAWSSVSVGSDHVCAIEAATAFLKCWGGNNYYQLGVAGPNITRSTPEPVLGGLQFAEVSAGLQFTCGILVNGTGVCWGRDKGALGTGARMSWSVQKEPTPIADVVYRGPFTIPEPTEPQQSSSSSSSNVGMIIGVSIACVVTVLLIAVGAFYLFQTRIKKKDSELGNKDGFEDEFGDGQGDDDMDGDFLEPEGDPYALLSIVSGDVDESTLKPTDLHFMRTPENLLGKGSFGTVYHAKLQGQPDVAVKCVPTNQGESLDGNDELLQVLIREVNTLKSCRSPHIVRYIGVANRENEVFIVMEYMKRGTLLEALKTRKVNWKNGGAQVAMDIASGLYYLHSRTPAMSHRDLKSSNVLLNADGKAKISDVGLSNLISQIVAKKGSNEDANHASPAWISMEQLAGLQCGPPSDIYAFGVILWEICSGEYPSRGRLREVRVPEECPQEVADLMKRCCDQHLTNRPTALEIMQILKSLS